MIAITAQYEDGRLGVVETLEKQSYDWRLNSGLQDAKKNTDIVIIDIDEDSLRELGRWPWSRDTFADLLDILFAKYNVARVGFTLPFPEADDAAVGLLRRIAQRLTYEQQAELSPLYAEFDYDALLADALADRSVHLGYRFNALARIEGALPPALEFVDGGRDGQDINPSIMFSLSSEWLLMRGYTGNLENFLRRAERRAGFVNQSADADGVVRRAPFFIRHAGDYYPSLPLSLLSGIQRLPLDSPLQLMLGDSSLFGGRSAASFSLQRFSGNLNRDGHGYLNFLARGGRNVDFAMDRGAAFRYLSFAEVLREAVEVNALDRKIVLIGSSAEALRDLHPTPVNPAMPGVELVATQLANIMDGEVLYRPANAQSNEIMLFLGVALIFAVLLAYLGPLTSGLIVAAVIAAYIYFVFVQWGGAYQVWSMIPMIALLTGMYIINAISGFFAEWRSGLRMKSTFGQYLPPEFAQKLTDTKQSINLEGEQRELTVLFSDIRGFTSISEGMSPQELTLLMNKMFTGLTEAIHDHGGTVDKFIGDAVMAFWNAPLEDEDHALNAVTAALAMQEAIQTLSAERAKAGDEAAGKIVMGVGIATGLANVGNMGSALRMTYTAIGDTVNLSSRTEGMTKHYRVPILVTESTYEQCAKHNKLAFRVIDRVRVKGREQPVTIYEPLGLADLLTPEQLQHLQSYEEARQAYEKGDFAAAKALFSTCREQAPDDGLIEVYLERVEKLLAAPSTETWDGVYSHTHK